LERPVILSERSAKEIPKDLVWGVLSSKADRQMEATGKGDSEAQGTKVSGREQRRAKGEQKWRQLSHRLASLTTTLVDAFLLP
jgi:hypothetical protein